MLAHRNARGRAAGICRVRSADHPRHQVLDQLLRVQRLSCGERRTRSLALAALHAGIETQQLVPAKLDRLADAIFLRVEYGHLERGRRHLVMLVTASAKALLTRMKREMKQP